MLPVESDESLKSAKISGSIWEFQKQYISLPAYLVILMTEKGEY